MAVYIADFYALIASNIQGLLLNDDFERKFWQPPGQHAGKTRPAIGRARSALGLTLPWVAFSARSVVQFILPVSLRSR
jgi:hypothetical protein